MWWLSHKEIKEILRETEEEYIRRAKASTDHSDKKYNTTGVFITRKLRNKLYNAMKKKYE